MSDRDPALLRYVGELGLYPGVRVRVLAAAPFNGPLTVRLGDSEQVIGRAVAHQILVTGCVSTAESIPHTGQRIAII